jgi:hypothetical protein
MATVQKRNVGYTARYEFSPIPVRNHAVEDKVFSLFQPDVLIPGQFMATTKSKTHRDPEQRLMLAVLEDAVWCFQNGLRAKDKKKQELSREAEQWMLEEDSGWLFSFNEICELLGIESNYLRKRLLKWKKETLSARTRPGLQRAAYTTRKGTGREKRHRLVRAAASF